MIPLVAASECGTAQTNISNIGVVGHFYKVTKFIYSRISWET